MGNSTSSDNYTDSEQSINSDNEILTQQNWAIISGELGNKPNFVSIINNKTTHELGIYIKNHVVDLFDHFYWLNEIACHKKNILNKKKLIKIIDVLIQQHGDDLFEPTNTAELAKNSNIIKKALKKLTNQEIVNGFNSSTDEILVRIIQIQQSTQQKLYDVDSVDNL